MRPSYWMVIGAGISLIYGFDLVMTLIEDQRISYVKLLFFLGGVVAIGGSYYEMKKKNRP